MSGMLRWLRGLVLRAPRPTVRGWAFLVAGIAAFVVMEWFQRREFAFVGLFLVGVPIVGALSSLLYRLPLTVERRFSPELAAAGSLVTARVIVRNWGRLPGPEAMWSDGVPAPLRAAPVQPFERLRAFRPSVTEAPTPRVLSYELEASHRGEHAIGPLTLFLTDPFGTTVRRAALGGTDSLTVTPATVPLPQGALRLASGSGLAQQSRRLGSGGEHDVISRKYQTGDSMRRVNWSATARFGELMVRQDDQQNDQHAIVVIDTAESSYEGAPGFSTEFEWAVSMAASIGVHLLAEGFHLRVIGGGGSGRASGAGSPHEEAALFEPTSGDVTTGGEDGLLLYAAKLHTRASHDIDYRIALDRAATTGTDVPPIFAVVGRLSRDSALSLASAARLSSGAVALIVAPDPHGDPDLPGWAESLRAELESAGWIAQIVTSDESPSAVWGTTVWDDASGERLVL